MTERLLRVFIPQGAYFPLFPNLENSGEKSSPVRMGPSVHNPRSACTTSSTRADEGRQGWSLLAIETKAPGEGEESLLRDPGSELRLLLRIIIYTRRRYKVERKEGSR